MPGKKNLKYLIRLLFFTYSSTNSKFGIGFAVPTNLITYLTNVEGFVYVCEPHKRTFVSGVFHAKTLNNPFLVIVQSFCQKHDAIYLSNVISRV